MRGRGARTPLPKRAGPGYMCYKLHPQLEKSSIHNSRGHFLSADGSDTVCSYSFGWELYTACDEADKLFSG